MIYHLCSLLRRPQRAGEVLIADVTPGRITPIGVFPEPITEGDIEAFRSRYVEINVACQYGRPGVASDPIAARLFAEFLRQREALAELVNLERYRDEHGPDADYLRCKVLVWAKALVLVPE